MTNPHERALALLGEMEVRAENDSAWDQQRRDHIIGTDAPRAYAALREAITTLHEHGLDYRVECIAEILEGKRG